MALKDWIPEADGSGPFFGLDRDAPIRRECAPDPALEALHAQPDLLDRLGAIGLDCADFKEVDGRLTVWVGNPGGFAELCEALPAVRFELVNGRAAVIP